MKPIHILASAALGLCMSLTACDEDLSQIGNSIVKGEVEVVSLDEFDIEARSVSSPDYDTRSTTLLLGRVSVPEYGDLRCAFVSQMMCAGTLQVPDSIGTERIDSVKMIVRVPRGSLTGDSLAPQRLTIYRLDKDLPKDIDNNFNPEGYFDKSSPIGSRSYTLSALNLKDTLFRKLKNIDIDVNLPVDLGKQIFTKYREDASIFAWPETFRKYFAGVYVEQSFGQGCIANVSSVGLTVYYHHLADKTFVENNEAIKRQIHVKDSVTLFSSSPEVLSSNIISYKRSEKLENLVANGHTIVSSPCGYNAEIKLPIRDLKQRYLDDDKDLTIINSLSLTIPASAVSNDYGIGLAPYLLMVRSSDAETFMRENKMPDLRTSFYAPLSLTEGTYTFSSMHRYMESLLEKEEITDDDCTFTLVPVLLTTEQPSQSYTSTIVPEPVVTQCTPYLAKPTMFELHVDRAVFQFVYSRQAIY